MLKKLRKEEKGFTLVELIVVLVILAILAAILVPALLGYIDRAREEQIVLDGKSCLTAAQTEMSSLYGEGKDASDITKRSSTIIKTAAGSETAANADFVVDALEVGTDATDDTYSIDHKKAYKITYVKYTEDGKTIYFNGKSWSTTSATAKGKTYSLKK